MKSTFHKCVLNAMTGPNPTPMSKSDKNTIKTPKNEIGPKWGRGEGGGGGVSLPPKVILDR